MLAQSKFRPAVLATLLQAAQDALSGTHKRAPPRSNTSSFSVSS